MDWKNILRKVTQGYFFLGKIDDITQGQMSKIQAIRNLSVVPLLCEGEIDNTEAIEEVTKSSSLCDLPKLLLELTKGIRLNTCKNRIYSIYPAQDWCADGDNLDDHEISKTTCLSGVSSCSYIFGSTYYNHVNHIYKE